MIIPARNEKNILEDLSEDLRADLKVHLVTEIDEVLQLALQPRPPVPAEDQAAAEKGELAQAR